MHEARYYEKREGGAVQCTLCPNFCVIADGHAGKCHVRVNREGILYARGWGIIPAIALDPIEKKPLVNFHPGTFILSAGFWGCNLSCRFCQNHEISQHGVPDSEIPGGVVMPQRLVAEAVDLMPQGNIGIAYTYNEPFTAFEYVAETAALAKEAGLLNVMVTNGYVNPQPLEEILPLIDAMNIDLKSFTDSFYSKVCGGKLEPVKRTIIRAASSCHVEVTTLVIPGKNSAPSEIDAIASWLASVSPDITLHLSRHHPDYRMPEPAPASRAEMHALADIARKRLANVFTGNC